LKLKGVDWEVLEKADHKILLNRLAVKKKIFSNILGNFTHIGDCRMKCCMKGQKVKNETSGRSNDLRTGLQIGPIFP
jgi:hypothetical protein